MRERKTFDILSRNVEEKTNVYCGKISELTAYEKILLAFRKKKHVFTQKEREAV